MESIVDETLMPFKEFEQKIYAYVCELGREITKHLLERYDKELATQRNTKVYRDKGPRKTTIKTLYGPVEYRRRVYRVKQDDGRVATVYLLDEAMKMDKIGLISSNLAEKIAMTSPAMAANIHATTENLPYSPAGRRMMALLYAHQPVIPEAEDAPDDAEEPMDLSMEE